MRRVAVVLTSKRSLIIGLCSIQSCFHAVFHFADNNGIPATFRTHRTLRIIEIQKTSYPVAVLFNLYSKFQRGRTTGVGHLMYVIFFFLFTFWLFFFYDFSFFLIVYYVVTGIPTHVYSFFITAKCNRLHGGGAYDCDCAYTY